MVKVEIDGMICEKVEEAAQAEEDWTLSTCLADPRFQQCNITKWCYTMFVDFHRCSHYLGPKHKHCLMFQKCYKSLCPNDWIHLWEEQLEDGTFPRDITKELGR